LDPNEQEGTGESRDSLEDSKLPLTAGLQQKRESKRSAKKNDLIDKIMKDHGLDRKERAAANKLNYDIPHLVMGKQLKSSTPVTQIFREAISENDQDWKANHTV